MAEYKNSIRLGVQLESAKDIDGKLKWCSTVSLIPHNTLMI